MNETVSMEVVLEMRDYIRQLEQKLAEAEKQDGKCENCGEFGECCKKQEPSEWLTGCPECGMNSCECDSGTWNPTKEQEPVVQQCKGIPRNGCDYLTACDTVCNKCGEIHHHHQMVAQFAPPPQREAENDDALRLAVQLRMIIDPYAGLVGIPMTGKLQPIINEGDMVAATRRAIVKAAAEIEKLKEKNT